ncbi:MAG: site-specific integrase [Muribaculaceae bacterium]|nr:site-specific integrase [Muribaculaceae bacterium]
MITNEFRQYLLRQNLSENTIKSYLFSIEHFFTQYNEMTKKNLLAYKGMLIEKYKAKTVNLRIQGINKYLEFLKRDKDKLKFIRIQQKTFLENVISNADYTFFKNQLKKDKNYDWYFVVRFLGATGARVSELVQIKVEHVKLGYIDLYTKGGKIRRIYIAKRLQKEALIWLEEKGKTTGYIFCNKKGERLTTRGVAHQLKELAIKYKMNPAVIYPHSFRHRFAKNFLEKYNDIALLADLMGHESIETTRIYLRRTSEEQQEIVDKVITW